MLINQWCLTILYILICIPIVTLFYIKFFKILPVFQKFFTNIAKNMSKSVIIKDNGWFLKKFLAISILLLINSCSSPKGWGFALKPHPLGGMKNFPPTDTDYGRGFKSGCEAGLLITSKGITDGLDATIDPILAVKNPDYSSGWFDGSEQCAYIMDWDVL
jgi:hypothetical protein